MNKIRKAMHKAHKRLRKLGLDAKINPEDIRLAENLGKDETKQIPKLTNLQRERILNQPSEIPITERCVFGTSQDIGTIHEDGRLAYAIGTGSLMGEEERFYFFEEARIQRRGDNEYGSSEDLRSTPTKHIDAYLLDQR